MTRKGLGGLREPLDSPHGSFHHDRALPNDWIWEELLMRRVKVAGFLIAAFGLSACQVEVVDTPSTRPVQPPADFAVFGSGFPNAGDPCRRAGESEFTSQFLDDAADLVACPPGVDTATFAANFEAREVARRDFWTLFSVPRR
jgi:hypothetical protein